MKVKKALDEAGNRILSYICEYQLASCRELGYPRPVSPKLNTISQDLGIPITTAWARLNSLAEEGYISRTDENYCEILKLPEVPEVQVAKNASKKQNETIIKTSKKHTATS